MLEMQRFFRTLVLTVLFSFFLWMISATIVIFLGALGTLFANTFLESLVSIVNIVGRTIFTVIKYISIVFFLLSFIGLIVIFYQDILKPRFKKDIGFEFGTMKE